MRKIGLTIVAFLLLSAAGCGEGTKTPDETLPVISEISASNITETSAVITWVTDENSSSKIYYGKRTTYGIAVPICDTLVLNHTVTLTDLELGTIYHYRVWSADASGNEAVSEDNTFATLADTTSPVISTITTSGITATQVTIAWDTSESATSLVEYGTISTYGLSSTSGACLVTTNSINLRGLTGQHYLPLPD